MLAHFAGWVWAGACRANLQAGLWAAQFPAQQLCSAWQAANRLWVKCTGEQDLQETLQLCSTQILLGKALLSMQLQKEQVPIALQSPGTIMHLGEDSRIEGSTAIQKYLMCLY